MRSPLSTLLYERRTVLRLRCICNCNIIISFNATRTRHERQNLLPPFVSAGNCVHVMRVVGGQQLYRQAPHKLDVVYNLQGEEWGVGAWLRLFECVCLSVYVCVCMFECVCLCVCV